MQYIEMFRNLVGFFTQDNFRSLGFFFYHDNIYVNVKWPNYLLSFENFFATGYIILEPYFINIFLRIRLATIYIGQHF